MPNNSLCQKVKEDPKTQDTHYKGSNGLGEVTRSQKFFLHQDLASIPRTHVQTRSGGACL